MERQERNDTSNINTRLLSEKFELVYHEEYRVKVHFTRETWNGRMKACGGIEHLLQKQRFLHGKRAYETTDANSTR